MKPFGIGGIEKNDYSKSGDTLIALDAIIKKQTNEDKAYIKLVDKDVVKGDLSEYEVITIDELNKQVADGTFDVKKYTTQKTFENYRVAFNINKNLSKDP